MVPEYPILAHADLGNPDRCGCISPVNRGEEADMTFKSVSRALLRIPVVCAAASCAGAIPTDHQQHLAGVMLNVLR